MNNVVLIIMLVVGVILTLVFYKRKLGLEKVKIEENNKVKDYWAKIDKQQKEWEIRWKEKCLQMDIEEGIREGIKVRRQHKVYIGKTKNWRL